MASKGWNDVNETFQDLKNVRIHLFPSFDDLVHINTIEIHICHISCTSKISKQDFERSELIIEKCAVITGERQFIMSGSSI